MNLITLFLIIIPIVCAIILFCVSDKYKKYKDVFFIIAALFNLWAVCFYFGKNIFSYSQWAAFDFSFSIVTSRFTSFLLIISAFFAVLTSVFTISNMKDNAKSSMFNASMLLAVAFVNGALITDSLIFFLIFIEALAVPFVLMILSSKENNNKLALKAFAITAVADLGLLMGISLLFALSGTMNISEISVELTGLWEITAFILIIIGAAGKLGVMPFHSWMPEASEKTPVPFMVFMATAAEKILGVYIVLLALKMFNAAPGSTVNYVLMGIAALSALIAALLANNQKSFKKMLVYTSISQGSFMMTAMLTAYPVAIAGAVLHLLAHTVYKSTLFFSAGIMDNTKADIISFKKNPYIFLCFILAIASFIGVPFFAAFYSKEFIYEGALGAGIVWYILMLLITSFCSSAVLNWFGRIFFGNDGEYVEYPVTSMIPVVTAAFLCLLLGIFKNIPLSIIQENISFTQHSDMTLIIISVSALTIVLLNFIIGYAKYNNGLGFVKGITSSLGIDKLNENEKADPFNIALIVYKSFGRASFDFDRGLNWIYDSLFVNAALKFSHAVKAVHNGNMSRYIFWVLVSITVIILFFV